MIGRGLGLITRSNFYVPQVNLPGSMATFVTPAGIPIPVAVAALHGSGAPNMNSLMPILLIGGGLVLMMMMMGKK